MGAAAIAAIDEVVECSRRGGRSLLRRHCTDTPQVRLLWAGL